MCHSKLPKSIASSMALLPLLVLTACSLPYGRVAGSDSDISAIVNEGLTNSQVMLIPIGTIQVLNPFESALGGAITEEGVYRHQYLQELRLLERIGLIQIREVPQRALGFLGGGARFKYEVSLTDRGRKAAEPKKENFVGVVLGRTQVTKVVKNEKYTNPNLPQSEDYRLVLGVYNYTPTDIGKEYFAARNQQLQSQYKVKALLKHNPFTSRYEFVALDWGYLDKDGWETHQVP